jgi:Ala-tRNA(Pro) deacylase
MISSRLANYLESNHVDYSRVVHAETYTAQELAASIHVPGRKVAKPVIVKIDGKLAMIIASAAEHLRLPLIRECLGAKKLELVAEDEFRPLFPDSEPGAESPFGNLYGLDVYLTPALAAESDLIFNAGSHWESVRITQEAFMRLVRPKVLVSPL